MPFWYLLGNGSWSVLFGSQKWNLKGGGMKQNKSKALDSANWIISYQIAVNVHFEFEFRELRIVGKYLQPFFSFSTGNFVIAGTPSLETKLVKNLDYILSTAL